MRNLLRIVLPLVFAQAAGAVNQIVDRLFLAHYGDVSLAACLPANMLATLFTCLIVTSLGYSGTFVAQHHGGERYEEAIRYFIQGLYLALLSIPIFLVLVPMAGAIIAVATESEAVAAAEYAYMRISLPGGIPLVLNAVLGGFVAGQGQTRTVAGATLIGTLANVAFDSVLICGAGPIPALGLTGAALATLLAQSVTTLLLAVAILRSAFFREHVRCGSMRPDIRAAGRMMRYGLPCGVTSFVSCFAFTVFTFFLGQTGEMPAAVSNAIFAVNNVFYFVLCAISDGLQIAVGRDHGAGDSQRAVTSVKMALALALGFHFVVFAVLLLLREPILASFLGPNTGFDRTAFLDLGETLMVILLFREVAEAVVCVMTGALRGVGDTKFVMKAQLIVEFGVWLPLMLFVATGSSGIAAPTLWLTMLVNLGLLSVVFLLRFFRSASWRSKRL